MKLFFAKFLSTKTLTLLFVIAICSQRAFAILTPVVDSIPLKDGKKMAIDIYKPATMSSGPVLLVQTPYNRQLYRFGLPLGIGNNINASNYIIVVADWRGYYGSKKAAYIGSPTIGDDGYSAVEWVAVQSWSNGKVGTWGPSALGRVQFQTAQKNPPHLVCICPLVAAPQYDYEEYFPNGDLRTEYVQQLDVLGFGLSKTLMAHPYFDNTWTFVEAANYYPDSIRVPCFMIGGWYDHTVEFMLPFFNAIRNNAVVGMRDQHRLLMGPWVHGGHGTAQVGTNVQGELTYPNSAAVNDTMALQYFDYHLRGIANGWNNTPFIKYYQMGENIWMNSATWPPASMSDVNFYLHKSGLIDNTPPTNSIDSLSYNYDPTNPSPTIGGSTLRNDLVQGPYDQFSQVESRNDILIFTSAALTKDVILKGSVTVHLKISSDKLDTDFDVRLTDVYPDGRSMLLKDAAARMRFRNGNTLALTAMMTPGKVYNCEIILPATCITFLAGHKIRLDISSSNYPRFNRNMNTGGTMYPGNSLDSLINPVTAHNTIYCNSVNMSSITLPLLGYSNGLANVVDVNAIEIYPNPAQNQLNIKLPLNAKVGVLEIYNALGQMVLSKKISDAFTPIDITNLPIGVYMLQWKADGVLQSKKFVKEGL